MALGGNPLTFPYHHEKNNGTSIPPIGTDHSSELDTSFSSSSSFNMFTGKPYSTNYKSLLATRQKLPVYGYHEKFLQMVSENSVLVLVGETGSGKTTQIPQFLVHALRPDKSNMKIACTQPRRVAAMNVAKRVAEEMDCNLGDQVGYTIRFDDCTSNGTLLKYLTDGMLLREAMFDPLLRSYAAILIDEAHERTVATDILMGLLKSILQKRSDLKVVIMSATLDAERFTSYFHNAPLLSIPGRTFPVEIYYTAEPEQNYLEAAVRTVLQIHLCEPAGDILVFLTGEEEIENACRDIRNEAANLLGSSGDRAGELLVLPLYSTLPSKEQQRIFDPAPPPTRRGCKFTRKVIIATNIAETSLTIDGIVYVVDPGFSKQKLYSPRNCFESLLVSPISQASANQRAGRAGRTQAGKCFRLYTEAAFQNDLIAVTYPEILRCNLASVVLQLKRLGIDDLVHFDFLDAPAPETMMRALELLHYLSALDEEGNLTQEGEWMADLPLEPPLAKVLLMSSSYHCADEMLSLVSLMSVPSPFLRPAEAKRAADAAKAVFEQARDGDHFTLLKVYSAYTKIRDEGKENLSSWCYQNFLQLRHFKSADAIRIQLERQLSKIESHKQKGTNLEEKHKKEGKLLNLSTQESNSLEDKINDGSIPPWKRSTNLPPTYFPEVEKQKIKQVDQTIDLAPRADRITQCLLAGFFFHVAHHVNGSTYTSLKDGQLVKLHPSSVLGLSRPEWVVYSEFIVTGQQYIRTVSRIRRPDWLFQGVACSSSLPISSLSTPSPTSVIPFYGDENNIKGLPEGPAKRALHSLFIQWTTTSLPKTKRNRNN